jgi:esterase/lipase superfamily enzyme
MVKRTMFRQILVSSVIVPGLIFASSAASQEPDPQSEAKSFADKSQPNWVDRYLADDQLAGRATVSLDDLNQALEDPIQRNHAIGRHFNRVTGATDEQKFDFLVSALKHNSLAVRRQAAQELASSGRLESIVLEQLSEFLSSGTPALKRAAIVALEHLDFDASEMPQDYWDELAKALASEDPRARAAAGAQLEVIGPAAVPTLLEALQSTDPEASHEAARRLSKIVGSRKLSDSDSKQFDRGLRTEKIMPDDSAMIAPPKAGANDDSRHAARTKDNLPPITVRVYYGTNREIKKQQNPGWSNILFYPALMALLLVFIFGTSRSSDETLNRTGCWPVLRNALLLALGIWAGSRFYFELMEKYHVATGPEFAFRRDRTDNVHYGFCDVSIPPTHITGEIESPLIGPEDENLHVILKNTALLEEAAYFETVRSEIARRDPIQRSCFIFVHGFNVSFEDAAKRTAQIHFDLKFPGTPIFFSWPSRNSVRQYFSDRNEIEFSQYVIQQFLLDVAERVDAERIHVIAHSMGADATCRAIANLGDRGKLFDQIILAAPDIDREVFRLQLAPRLTPTANRTTMYCSKNDFALQVSNTFNDGLRAGDSSRGILALRGVDTVDASEIDTDLLGHSYYGDCLQIIDDVQSLLVSNLPPDRRQLVPWPVTKDLRYWTFAERVLQSDAKNNGAEKSGEPAGPAVPQTDQSKDNIISPNPKNSQSLEEIPNGAPLNP